MNLEHWHTKKLSVDEADKYHERLMLNGNILTYIIEGELIGYLEFWLISFEQLGRLVCNQAVFCDENLLDGNIALINNMWIKEDERGALAFEVLAAQFLSRCKHADFYVAFRRTKRHQPIQVYSRSEIMKHFKRS
jgi:hypothetical protein